MAYQPPQIYSVFILSHQTAQKNGGVNCQLQISRTNTGGGFYIPAPRVQGRKPKMKQIEKWLTDNGITYRPAK